MTWRRIFLLVVWALLVLTGFLARYWLSYQPRPPQRAWRAARQLPERHQLRPDDLEKPNAEMDASSLPPLDTLVGYHLVAAKGAGDVVEPKDIAPAPALGPVGEDESYVLYPLTEDELATADLLKPGDYVQPCVVQLLPRQPVAARAPRNDAVMCSGMWLEVAAVHRKSAPAPVDWIVLKVPRAGVAKAMSLATATPRRLVVGSAKGVEPAPQRTPPQTRRRPPR